MEPSQPWMSCGWPVRITVEMAWPHFDGRSKVIANREGISEHRELDDLARPTFSGFCSEALGSKISSRDLASLNIVSRYTRGSV